MHLRALAVILILAIPSSASALHLSDESIRIGFTSVMSRSDINTINQLTDYISERIERQVWPIFANSHTEMGRLLTSGSVDFAWIDPGTLITTPDIQIIAAPSYEHGPYYFSYIVVRRDRTYDNISALKGKPFAFGNSQSFSGSVAPSYELSRLGHQADRFFRPLIYTDDHINVIKAVNDGFVEGGSISSIVFTQLSNNARVLVENLRILHEFGPYPSPPIVSSIHTQDYIIETFRNTLLSLHQHDSGIVILGKLGIDRFLPVALEHYYTIDKINTIMNTQPLK
jgi:phosphonate transport system substrate-binding protein